MAWTCDGLSVLGAGNDKSIRVWDPLSGRERHTMTGHTGKVRRGQSTPCNSSTVLCCWHSGSKRTPTLNLPTRHHLGLATAAHC